MTRQTHPCVFCKQPPRPSNQPCPSCRGTTLHSCVADSYDQRVHGANLNLKIGMETDRFVDPENVLPRAIEKLEQAIDGALLGRATVEPARARELIGEAWQLVNESKHFVDLYQDWHDAVGSLQTAIRLLTCAEPGCEAPIEPDCNEPDRCLTHGTMTFTEQHIVLEGNLATFAREVGKGDPAVGGKCHCGGLFLAYQDGACAHTKPVCTDYRECEPDEYLKRVRTKTSH